MRCASAFTVLTGAPISDALRISRARENAARPAIPVVWGGWHPSMFARANACSSNRSMSRFRGQGEETFCGDRPAARRRPARCKAVQDALSDSKMAPSRRIRPGTWRRSISFARMTMGLIPVERYYELKRQAAAGLHLVSRLVIFVARSARIPFVYGRKMGRARTRPHGAQIERAVGPVPL